MKAFLSLLALTAAEFRFFNESCGDESLEQEGNRFNFCRIGEEEAFWSDILSHKQDPNPGNLKSHAIFF